MICANLVNTQTHTKTTSWLFILLAQLASNNRTHCMDYLWSIINIYNNKASKTPQQHAKLYFCTSPLVITQSNVQQNLHPIASANEPSCRHCHCS